jgi:hypothetical protein
MDTSHDVRKRIVVNLENTAHYGTFLLSELKGTGNRHELCTTHASMHYDKHEKDHSPFALTAVSW